MATGPQAIVAAFCREDALGARSNRRAYGRVAALVAWPLEPAWDSVVLIRGFEVGEPQRIAPEEAEVAVTYTVVGGVSALRYDVEAHLAVRRFRVVLRDGRWWISGAPPLPHVFSDRVDPERVRRAMQGDGGYLSQSRFVAELMRAGGWKVPVETVAELLSGATYGPVATARPGDLAVYLDRGNPYHVGVVEAPGVVVSATLTGGLARSTLGAFAGEVRFLRLREIDGIGEQ